MKFNGPVGRTITDNIWFTPMTNNGNQIHFNADYVWKGLPRGAVQGGMVVNGFLTLATVAGMLIERTSAHGTVLGLSNVRFVNPVFAGGTIYTECEVMGARKSENRKANEIVSVRTWYSQRGEKVVEFDRDFMVRERGAVWGSATGARAKRGRPR